MTPDERIVNQAPLPMDPVLTGAKPRLGSADAVALGATLFGLRAHAARDAGSERDRTFLLEDPGGAPVAVLKVSNAAEDPEVLDMEAAAALHVTAVDPGLRVALPWRAAATGDPGPARPGDDPALLRAEWRDGERTHPARPYHLPSRPSRNPAPPPPAPAPLPRGRTTAR